MQVFQLFGREVAVPMELSNYNTFRDKYIKKAENAYKEFSVKYKRFSSIDEVLDGYKDVCTELLDPIIKAAISDLLANKVLDINSERIFDALCKKGKHGVLNVEIALDSIQEKYEEIIEDQQAKADYRRTRRQGHGRWVGGGFGVEGAVKGAVQAGALNAAGGIAHGAANLVGNTFTAIGSGIKKMALFDNPSTYKILVAAISQDCVNILFVLVDALKKNGMAIKSITTSDTDSAKVLISNISNPDFPKGEVLTALVQAALLDPYQADCYRLMIDRFGDKDNEVERLAAYLHMDEVMTYKENKVREYFKTLPTTTLNEALDARDKVVSMCVNLGGVPNTVNEEIEQLIEDIKYKRLYEEYAKLPKNTIDEWYACKEKIKLLSKELEVADDGKKILMEIGTEIVNFKCGLADEFLSGIPKTTEDEAVEAKKRLEAYCDEIELSRDNLVMSKIVEIIKKIDTDIRTVEGYEFDNREKSKKATAEKAAIDALLDGRAPVSKNDYHLLLQHLNSNKITPELEQIYRKRYDDALKRIDKLTKRASAYEYRRGSRFKLFGGNKKGIIIHSIVYAVAMLFNVITAGAGLVITIPPITVWEIIKRVSEKKAWNELTHKGQYVLSVILATDDGSASYIESPVISDSSIGKGSGDDAVVQEHNPNEEYLFCVKCGTKLPSSVHFCDNCGAPVWP